MLFSRYVLRILGCLVLGWVMATPAWAAPEKLSGSQAWFVKYSWLLWRSFYIELGVFFVLAVWELCFQMQRNKMRVASPAGTVLRETSIVEEDPFKTSVAARPMAKEVNESTPDVGPAHAGPEPLPLTPGLLAPRPKPAGPSLAQLALQKSSEDTVDTTPTGSAGARPPRRQVPPPLPPLRSAPNAAGGSRVEAVSDSQVASSTVAPESIAGASGEGDSWADVLRRTTQEEKESQLAHRTMSIPARRIPQSSGSSEPPSADAGQSPAREVLQVNVTEVVRRPPESLTTGLQGAGEDQAVSEVHKSGDGIDRAGALDDVVGPRQSRTVRVSGVAPDVSGGSVSKVSPQKRAPAHEPTVDERPYGPPGNPLTPGGGPQDSPGALSPQEPRPATDNPRAPEKDECGVPGFTGVIRATAASSPPLVPVKRVIDTTVLSSAAPAANASPTVRAPGLLTRRIELEPKAADSLANGAGAGAPDPSPQKEISGVVRKAEDGPGVKDSDVTEPQ